MQSGVIRIQNMTQNRLNGSPRTMGSMRSQSETEKHVATNGMRPIRRALMDGRFTFPRTPSLCQTFVEF